MNKDNSLLYYWSSSWKNWNRSRVLSYFSLFISEIIDTREEKRKKNEQDFLLVDRKERNNNLPIEFTYFFFFFSFLMTSIDHIMTPRLHYEREIVDDKKEQQHNHHSWLVVCLIADRNKLTSFKWCSL